MARNLKARIGDTLLGRERFEALRAYYYGRKQGAANARTLADHANPDSILFAEEIGWLTARGQEWVVETAREFRAAPNAWKQLSGLRSPNKYTDGVIQTLDVAEGFALWALVKHVRPHVVVELGTQYGLTARLWKEALNRYQPDHRLYLCDIVDVRRYIGADEAIFMLGDGQASLEKIVESEQVGILYNDAHPYTLIRSSIATGLDAGIPCFAFHDVGGRELRGFPFLIESAALSEEEKIANSLEFVKYGHWERHCMAEVFDQRILTETSVATEKWRLQIFDSLFGFGVALATDKVGEYADRQP